MAFLKGPRSPRPEQLTVRAWFVVAGLCVATLIAGALTSSRAAVTMALAFGPLVAICVAYSSFEWVEARRLRESVISRWHLAGAVLALAMWAMLSTRPPGSSEEEIQIACSAPPLGVSTATCLADADAAEWGNRAVSWSTLGIVALLAAAGRHSRVAAWSTLMVATAGQTLALQFIREFLRKYVG
jgi:hypothetical protein